MVASVVGLKVMECTSLYILQSKNCAFKTAEHTYSVTCVFEIFVQESNAMQQYWESETNCLGFDYVNICVELKVVVERREVGYR